MSSREYVSSGYELAHEDLIPTRKDWDEYFLDICDMVATRRTCPKLDVGVVLVKDKRIIATGYNGAPPGMPHCIDVGCFEVDNHCKRALHAEENIILMLPPKDLLGTTLYLSHTPCTDCMNLICNTGIARIIYRRRYKECIGFDDFATYKGKKVICKESDSNV